MFEIFEYPRYRYGYGYEPVLWRSARGVHRRLARMLLQEMFDESLDETEQKQQQEREEQTFSSHVVRKVSRKGDEVVEEHLERVTNGDGSVHAVTRRQIGDRWYVHESHSDKDGVSTTKETWHNVSDGEIDSFKKEWDAKHGRGIEHEEAPAIEQEVSVNDE